MGCRVSSVTMRKLDPTCQKHTITKPVKPSEFDIQAYIYAELKAIGVDIRGEVIHRAQGRQCRFDLVIFSGNTAKAIIEVKTEGSNSVQVNGRQCTRYREYGVPVYYIHGMHQAGVFIERCKLKRQNKT